MAKNMPLVLVEWLDAAGNASWIDPADIRRRPIVCETVAWLFERNKEAIVLISSRTDEGTVSDRNTIPRRCVTRITRLSILGDKEEHKRG